MKKVKKICNRYVEKIFFKYYCNKLLVGERKTSVTDNEKYPVVCYMASRHEHFFKGFRQNEVYNQVLEHVTQSQGQEYLDVISKYDQVKFTDVEWDSFCDNDLYGNPKIYPYKINGRNLMVSPTTLRYAKVLQDIVSLYDVRNIQSVAEIGIGYAGQCRLLTSYLPGIENYFLFDLPEVLGLAQKYLGKFGESVIGRAKFVDGTKIDIERDYDLVISNYAFSELIRDVQDIYLEKVILKAKAGYITWNTLSCDRLDGYSLEELLKIIPGSSIIKEEPLTKANNCIIVWGNSSGINHGNGDIHG